MLEEYISSNKIRHSHKLIRNCKIIYVRLQDSEVRKDAMMRNFEVSDD
jgi:hypothetical protein